MSRSGMEENDISQDFEKLVGKKSQSSESEQEINTDEMNQQVARQKMLQQQQQQMMQQKMMQQQMMQQQMLQQQMMQQAQQNKQEQKEVEVKVINETKENFTTEKPLLKVLSLLGVLFALFFVFASKQVEGAVSSIPYLSNLTFQDQVNLVIRAILFITIFFIVNTYLL
jgi:cation transport ATPase